MENGLDRDSLAHTTIKFSQDNSSVIAISRKKIAIENY